MPVSITALYAGLLALIFVALAINVTAHRVKLSVPLGDGGNSQMLRMMRLHGNAAAAHRWHRPGRGPLAANLGNVGDRNRRLRPRRRAKPNMVIDRGARRAQSIADRVTPTR